MLGSLHRHASRHLVRHGSVTAQQALTELAATGEPVTVALLADRTGASRSWTYTQPSAHPEQEQINTTHVTRA